HGCATGSVANVDVRWHTDRSAVTVVAASQHYPDSGPRGLPIRGLDEVARLPDTLVFHAGTRCEGHKVLTAGGRVLAVTGLGASLEEARTRAYAGMERVRFDGMQVRSDIGSAVGSGLLA